MSATLAVGAGAGLPLAGLIVAYLDWHAIFWVTALTGVVLIALVAWVVPKSPLRSGGSFDWSGALLLSAAVTALLLALSKGSTWGWLSAPTILLAALGLALLAAWVPIELRSGSPIVDIRVSARTAVLLVNGASVLAGFAMFTNQIATTQLLQQDGRAGYGLGLDAFHAGLWMAPSALVFGAMAPASAWIIRRSGAQLTLLIGALVMAAAYVVRVPLSRELGHVVAGTLVVAAGTSMVFAAMPTLIMAAVPATETAAANGLNTLLRSVGTSTASAALAALTTGLVITAGDTQYPSYGAFTTVFWLAAGASAVAGLLTVPLLRPVSP